MCWCRRDETFLACHVDRRTHLLKNAGGDDLGVVLIDHFGQQRDELVAAEPAHCLQRAEGACAHRVEQVVGHLVRVPHAGAQATRHLDQQLVASAVPQRVVDDLESVQVDHQQAHLMAHATRRIERTLGAFDQLVAVGQAGERVEIRQLADLVLGDPAVCHVLHDAGVADQLALLVEFWRRLGVDDVHLAIGQHQWNVACEIALALQGFAEQCTFAAPFFLRHHPQQIAKRQRGARVELENTQGFGREHRLRRARLPFEAAHPRQILRAGQPGLTQFQFKPGARRAQQVAQAAVEQAPLVGLDEEVGSAGLVGSVDRGLVIEARQHQHGQRREGGHPTQFATGLEAVHARHQCVEHDHVGLPLAQQLERSLAAGGLGDREAALTQRDRGQQQVDFVVVDQQHTWLQRGLVGGGRV